MINDKNFLPILKSTPKIFESITQVLVPNEYLSPSEKNASILNLGQLGILISLCQDEWNMNHLLSKENMDFIFLKLLKTLEYSLKNEIQETEKVQKEEITPKKVLSAIERRKQRKKAENSSQETNSNLKTEIIGLLNAEKSKEISHCSKDLSDNSSLNQIFEEICSRLLFDISKNDFLIERMQKKEKKDLIEISTSISIRQFEILYSLTKQSQKDEKKTLSEEKIKKLIETKNIFQCEEENSPKFLLNLQKLTKFLDFLSLLVVKEDLRKEMIDSGLPLLNYLFLLLKIHENFSHLQKFEEISENNKPHLLYLENLECVLKLLLNLTNHNLDCVKFVVSSPSSVFLFIKIFSVFVSLTKQKSQKLSNLIFDLCVFSIGILTNIIEIVTIFSFLICFF